MTEDLTTAEGFNAAAKSNFPGHFDITVTNVEHGVAKAEMRVGSKHLTPTGFMHGAAVVGIADTVCGAKGLSRTVPSALLLLSSNAIFLAPQPRVSLRAMRG